MSVIADDLSGVIRFHFLSLRGAVKLESKGLKRSRGPSARTIAIKELNLPRNSSYSEVIDAISRKLGDGVACSKCKKNQEYCTCQK